MQRHVTGRLLPIALLTFVLAACGGGEGDSGGATETTVEEMTETTMDMTETTMEMTETTTSG